MSLYRMALKKSPSTTNLIFFETLSDNDMGEIPRFRLSEWSIRLSDQHCKVNEGNACVMARKSAVAWLPIRVQLAAVTLYSL